MLKINKIKEIKNLNIIIAVVIMLIIGIFCLNQSKSLWVKFKKLKTEIDKQTKDLSKISTLLSTQDNLNLEIDQLSAEISQAKENFFFNTEDIFTYINQFAESSKISLKSIEPLEIEQAEQSKGKGKKEIKEIKEIAELPVNLKIKCDYHQLISFLKKIENTPKLIIVDEIDIRNDPRDLWNHDIGLLLKAPILLNAGNK